MYFKVSMRINPDTGYYSGYYRLVEMLQRHPRDRSKLLDFENRPRPPSHIPQERREHDGAPAPGAAGLLGREHRAAPVEKEKIRSDWREIVRVMNTQKAVTTTALNASEDLIVIRACSEPNQKVKQLYEAMKYKPHPFKRKKICSTQT